MTTDEFNKKLDAQMEALMKDNKPLQIAVKTIMGIQSKRIWLDGKNKDGSNIGDYKGGELYVSPKSKGKRSIPSFPLKGKAGDTKFKSGKSHKSGYFKNYLAFKKTIGRNQRVQSVDLLLTGTLSQNWANAPVLSQAQAQKINVNNYIVTLSKESTDKVERYGVNEVFGLSVVEKGKFLGVVQYELGKMMRGNV